MNSFFLLFNFAKVMGLLIVLNCIALLAISFVLDNAPVEKKKQLVHPDNLEIGDVVNLLNEEVMCKMFPGIGCKAGNLRFLHILCKTIKYIFFII